MLLELAAHGGNSEEWPRTMPLYARLGSASPAVQWYPAPVSSHARRPHHGFLCEIDNAAGRAIYRAAGCDVVNIEPAACIDRGDRAGRYVIRW